MANFILDDFYADNITTYTQTQPESIVKRSIDPQIWREMAFRFTFHVPAMIGLSRIVENTVIENRRAADTFVSFQYLSRLPAQERKYQAVAQSARGLWLYGARDLAQHPIFEMPNVRIIDTAESKLLRYWFVVAYGGGVSMGLLAQETEPRLYQGFYTFEPEVNFQIVQILHQLHPEQVPAPRLPQYETGSS